MAGSPDSLTMALEFLHQAIADHPDPQAKQTLSNCLAQMTRVQANDHAQQNDGGARGAVLNQLGGQ